MSGQDSWIDVRDRLPDLPTRDVGQMWFVSLDVLVWDGLDCHVANLWRKRDGASVFATERFGNVDGVTHWMPLPEPPKPKKP